MHLDRHHDKLTVRDETVIAHEEGSIVELMEVSGEVTLQGNLRVTTVNHRGDMLDLRDERVHLDTLNSFSRINKDGEWVVAGVRLPANKTIRVGLVDYRVRLTTTFV